MLSKRIGFTQNEHSNTDIFSISSWYVLSLSLALGMCSVVIKTFVWKFPA